MPNDESSTKCSAKILLVEAHKAQCSMIKSVVPTPSKCYLTSLILFLVSAGMASTDIVVRKRLDAQGHVVLNSTKRPLVEVDHWASFWKGWLLNIPFLPAVFMLILGVALWIRSKIKGKHNSETVRSSP